MPQPQSGEKPADDEQQPAANEPQEETPGAAAEAEKSEAEPSAEQTQEQEETSGLTKYSVVSRIGMHGKEYEAGDTIELSDEEAAAMPWAIAKLEQKEEEQN